MFECDACGGLATVDTYHGYFWSNKEQKWVGEINSDDIEIIMLCDTCATFRNI